jgi:hypothetical protein
MKPSTAPTAARPIPMDVLTLDAPLLELDVDVADEPEPVPEAVEAPATELVG